MPFLPVDEGVRLWYQLDGPPDAPLLMLSNSLGTNLALWRAQMPAFTSRFRVLRYDSRGHGQSDPPRQPYGIERLGRDVLSLLDGLDVRRAHFCGVSMGAMTGMWLGCHAPERIDRLALCNTAARIGPLELWNKRIEAIRAGGLTAILPAVIERWFSAPFRARAPDEVERAAAMLHAVPAEGYIEACAAIRDMDLRDDIATIHARTLVVAGSYDEATPSEHGRFIASQIPNAGYVELPAAHLSNIEAADDFTAAVVMFLTE